MRDKSRDDVAIINHLTHHGNPLACCSDSWLICAHPDCCNRCLPQFAAAFVGMPSPKILNNTKQVTLGSGLTCPTHHVRRSACQHRCIFLVPLIDGHDLVTTSRSAIIVYIWVSLLSFFFSYDSTRLNADCRVILRIPWT